MRGRQLRDQCVAPRSPGGGSRTRRRGGRSVVQLRRDRERGGDHRCAAGLRGHRPRHVLPGRRRRGGCGHAEDGGGDGGAPLRSARRSGRASPPDGEAGPVVARGRLSGAWRRQFRHSRGCHRTAGRFQLLRHQEHDDRRGRHGGLRGRGGRPEGAAAAKPGHGAALPQRDRGPQQPDDRSGCRDRTGSAGQTGRLERREELPSPSDTTRSCRVCALPRSSRE